MNDLLLKFIMAYLTDENIRKLVAPIKQDLFNKVEASAKSSPEIWDDIAVRVLKAILGL